MNRKDYLQNLIMLISVMAVFGTVGIISGNIPYPSGVQAMVRSVLGFLFIVAFMLITRRKPDFFAIKRYVWLLLASGICLGFNWILFFEALKATTISTATLSYYFAPIILTLLSPVLFKEKLGAKKIICICVALVGMVLISGVIGDAPEGVSVFGIALGLMAAVLYASVVTFNKKMKEIDAFSKTASQFLVSAVVLVPYVLIFESGAEIKLEPLPILLILLLGVVHTGVAYVIYFGTAARLPAHTLSIYSYIDPIVALILSVVIAKDTVTPLGVIGAVLILGSSFICEFSPKKMSFAKSADSIKEDSLEDTE